MQRQSKVLVILCGLLLTACVHKIDTPKGLPSDGVNRNPPGVVTR